MSPGDEGGRCLGLTTLPHSCADFLELREPRFPGTLRACPDLYLFIAFTRLESKWRSEVEQLHAFSTSALD